MPLRCQAEDCQQAATDARAVVIDGRWTAMAMVWLCAEHGRCRPLWSTWRRRAAYTEPTW